MLLHPEGTTNFFILCRLYSPRISTLFFCLGTLLLTISDSQHWGDLRSPWPAWLLFLPVLKNCLIGGFQVLLHQLWVLDPVHVWTCVHVWTLCLSAATPLHTCECTACPYVFSQQSHCIHVGVHACTIHTWRCTACLGPVSFLSNHITCVWNMNLYDFIFLKKIQSVVHWN